MCQFIVIPIPVITYELSNTLQQSTAMYARSDSPHIMLCMSLVIWTQHQFPKLLLYLRGHPQHAMVRPSPAPLSMILYLAMPHIHQASSAFSSTTVMIAKSEKHMLQSDRLFLL